MYGNTSRVAAEIAAGLRERGVDVEEALVQHVTPDAAANVDLLVVGGPTHGHGMSSPRSRRTAAEDDANGFQDPSIEPGLREWLERLPPGDGRAAAAFDTRIDKPAFLTGSAAKGIAKRLGGSGYGLVAGPESFLVTIKNALCEGEVDHARRWGAGLGGA